MSIKLKDLLKAGDVSSSEKGDVLVTGLTYDSRQIKKGDVFFAVKGTQVDGHAYIEDSEKKGAVAVLAERNVKATIPVIPCNSLMAVMSKAANFFFESPSQKIPVIGITGTNGKTTVTYILEKALKSLGKSTGVMGTVNYRIGSDTRPALNTTPMSIDVHQFLRELLNKKVDAAVMEVSSHALALHRVEDVTFKIGVFTNLTQDHLDFHKDMESYFNAKKKLFKQSSTRAVINFDDPYGARLIKDIPDAMTFGFNEGASLRATEPVADLNGITFTLHFPDKTNHQIHTKLMGQHNIYNVLAAAGVLLALGHDSHAVAKALNQDFEVPGRLERVEAGQEFVVLVDYAHTHDALKNVLQALKETNPKRILTVFGAGGDRDRKKRPLMGQVAVKYSDVVFVTSDNPRTENPKQILDDIEAGIKEVKKTNYEIIGDREAAIKKAVGEAKKGDIVLIAGKGHETYQIIGTKKHHFSDQEIARTYLS